MLGVKTITYVHQMNMLCYNVLLLSVVGCTQCCVLRKTHTCDEGPVIGYVKTLPTPRRTQVFM